MEIKQVKIIDLKPYEKNNKIHGKAQIDLLAKTIQEFGFTNPILLAEDNSIIGGHGRLESVKQLGWDEVPCVYIKDLSKSQIRKLRLLDNKIAELAEDNLEAIKFELEELQDLELNELYDFDLEIVEDKEEVEDDVPEVQENIIVEKGDIFQLGNHRIICGNSLAPETYEKLLGDVKIDLGFNDPPYGMKLQSKGVNNDNLNYNDLLQFNKEWISLQFGYLKDNGSFYCWGIDEPLMDIYSEILKPYIREQKATFRNLITWDKGNGQGQNSENTRSYAIADEKCLFAMCGVQGFNNNTDNYFEGWEPIRSYFEENVKKIGKLGKHSKVNEILGFSPTSANYHYFTGAQFQFMPIELYQKLQSYCEQNNIDAFKKEYDELKKEYYSTRAYFNNIHDNFNNVWKFDRTSNTERETAGGHYTPKPIALCSRGILSSSPEGGTVLDSFLGSGSTLIACEKEKRTCYGIEMSEAYIQTIIKRFYDYTDGKKEIKCLNRKIDLESILNPNK